MKYVHSQIVGNERGRDETFRAFINGKDIILSCPGDACNISTDQNHSDKDTGPE